jgi:hypothetical protein
MNLGVDLAPTAAKTALLAFNDAISYRSELFDPRDRNKAAEAKQTLGKLSRAGFTDFNEALASALELFSDSPASEKHFILIADICESGFKLQTGAYEGARGRLAELIAAFAESGIRVHMIFLNEPKENLDFMPFWEELAAITGGGITYAQNAVELPKIVEELYFTAFAYNKSVLTGFNATDAAQEITVRLPDFALNRARIYISGAPSGVQAYSDGTLPVYDSSRSYFIAEYGKPFPKSVNVVIPPGKVSEFSVVLLADGTLTVGADVESTAEPTGNGYTQRTEVTLSAESSGEAVSLREDQPDTEWEITVTSPAGAVITPDHVTLKNGKISFDFYPEVFGAYTAGLSIVSRGIRLHAYTEIAVGAIEIPVIADPEPEIDPPPKKDYSLWIAIAIGAALIILAIAAARVIRRHKRAKVEVIPAAISAAPGQTADTEPDVSFPREFTGKLDFYGVLLDGGKAELPPVSYRLAQFAGSKKVTLSALMERAGIPYRYRAAADISFFPGQDETLLVKNQSEAVIYSGGMPYRKGQRLELAYGQKIRVIFEEDVNEYEIFYHSAPEPAVPGSSIRV